MAATRKHVATRGQAPVAGGEKAERDTRTPLRDDAIAELLAVAAQAAMEAAPRTKGAPALPPRVNPPPSWPATRTSFAAMRDGDRRAALLLLVLDEGQRLEIENGASLTGRAG